MRVVWTSFDAYSGEVYNKDFIVGGVLDIACFEFLNLPKKAKSIILENISTNCNRLGFEI